MSDQQYSTKFKRMMAILKVIEHQDKYDEVGGKLNRSNLAKMIGVSTRTVDRYINVLKNELDLPITYNRDTKTYEYFDKSMEKENNNLNKNEILLLLMFLDSSKSFNGLEITNIKEKLLNKLPKSFKNRLEEVRKNFGYTKLKEAKGNLTFVEQIQKAILREKVIELDYEAAYKSDLNKKRKVIPYGVTWDNDKGYFIGKDVEDDKIINYRLDRINDIKITEEPGIIPEDFNIDEYVSKCWKMFFGDLTKIKLEVDNNLLPLMKDKFNPEYYKITEKDENTFIFETEIRGVNLFKGWLLSLKTQIKVLDPKFLRDELIMDAKNIISMYE